MRQIIIRIALALILALTLAACADVPSGGNSGGQADVWGTPQSNDQMLELDSSGPELEGGDERLDLLYEEPAELTPCGGPNQPDC